MKASRHPASFRDPSGFIFTRGSQLCRQVNPLHREAYEALRGSGLYEELTGEGLLLPHRETDSPQALSPEAYKILELEPLPFISYPYEWCFSQLKDAALLTLKIQKKALERGLCLKDASAYNVQFLDGKPVFIDTLSFGIYENGKPWNAYRQFCEHFLAPLALMSCKDIRLGKLWHAHPQGIPLDLACKLLPKKTLLNLGLLLHLHLHSTMQKKNSKTALEKKGSEPSGMSLPAIQELTAQLENTVKSLKWNPKTTLWTDYEDTCAYSAAAQASKENCVSQWLQKVQPKIIYDLGANTGHYSRLAASCLPSLVLSIDADPGAVEKNYQRAKESGMTPVFPLWMDLSNPTPGLGWAEEERCAFSKRASADLVIALAVMHHWILTDQVPLSNLAAQLARWSPRLILEFVPLSDPQARRLIGRRKQYHQYEETSFQEAFLELFDILERRELTDSTRVLYLMKRK